MEIGLVVYGGLACRFLELFQNMHMRAPIPSFNLIMTHFYTAVLSCPIHICAPSGPVLSFQTLLFFVGDPSFRLMNSLLFYLENEMDPVSKSDVNSDVE